MLENPSPDPSVRTDKRTDKRTAKNASNRINQRGAATRREILILSVATALMLGWLYYRWHSLNSPDRLRQELAAVMPSFRVQVEGDIAKPGVYELPGGAVIEDLLAKAEPKLDISQLPRQWLEMPLRDGQKVQLWKRDGTPQLALGRMDGSVMGLLLIPLNLNDATEDELAALPGIGPSTAKAIVEHRQSHGPFRRLEDLTGIKGIGDKTVESLRYRAVVAPPSEATRTSDPSGAPPVPSDHAPASSTTRVVSGSLPEPGTDAATGSASGAASGSGSGSGSGSAPSDAAGGASVPDVHPTVGP